MTRTKIDNMFSDINNLYADYDRGKIDVKTADKHIKNLCKWYLGK